MNTNNEIQEKISSLKANAGFKESAQSLKPKTAVVPRDNQIFKINSGANVIEFIKNIRYTSFHVNVYQCKFSIGGKSPGEILNSIKLATIMIKEYIQSKGNKNLIWVDTISAIDFEKVEGEVVILDLTRKMHRIISEGHFMEQVEYIGFVGLRDEISRQEKFQKAINFYKFQEQLKKRGIKNNFQKEKKPKRIHAVHIDYVRFDDEIGNGLKVTLCQHSDDFPVFVESIESLTASLEHCQIDSTLVVDGHWVHGKSSMNGVWSNCCADELAVNIATLVNRFPGKISKIKLWGCESGALAENLDSSINPDRLFFRNNTQVNSNIREMADFRNSAIYVSENGETPFDKDSLAAKLLWKLEDKSISVTATPRFSYPYPQFGPRFNIASDAESWTTPHHWMKTQNSNFYKICRNTKCITQQRHLPDPIRYQRFKDNLLDWSLQADCYNKALTLQTAFLAHKKLGAEKDAFENLKSQTLGTDNQEANLVRKAVRFISG